MRVFVAIELDRSLKKVLAGMIDGLAEFRKAVRWARPEQLHLTLKFLGEVPDARVPEVCDACRRLACDAEPFALAVDRCGCFPPGGKVRVIWGGMAEPSAGLLDCAARGEDAWERLGFPRERRPFTAHMTVGRVRDDRSVGRLRDAIASLSLDAASQSVNAITVFQSVLGPRGAAHHALGRFPLGGAMRPPASPKVEAG